MKHDSFALALVVLLFASDCLPSKGLSPQLTGSTGSIGMALVVLAALMVAYLSENMYERKRDWRLRPTAGQ